MNSWFATWFYIVKKHFRCAFRNQWFYTDFQRNTMSVRFSNVLLFTGCVLSKNRNHPYVLHFIFSFSNLKTCHFINDESPMPTVAQTLRESVRNRKHLSRRRLWPGCWDCEGGTALGDPGGGWVTTGYLGPYRDAISDPGQRDVRYCPPRNVPTSKTRWDQGMETWSGRIYVGLVISWTHQQVVMAII